MQQNHHKSYQDFSPPAPPLKLITKKIRRYCFFTWKQMSKHWLWAESLLATLLSYRWRSMERHFLLHLVPNKTMISPAFWFLQYKNWGEKRTLLNQRTEIWRKERSKPPQHAAGLRTWLCRLAWNRHKLSLSSTSLWFTRGNISKKTTKKQHINRCKMFLFKWNAHRSAKEVNFMLPNGRKAAL